MFGFVLIPVDNVDKEENKSFY